MRTGWLSWVRANDKTIINILESQGANLVTATSSLVELLTHFDALMERGSKIKDLEHEGDKITHDLFAITSQTFVTPLDREDISRLTTGIDQLELLLLQRLVKESYNQNFQQYILYLQDL
jgi:uncharacterized protein Yka (UPF0111/DUF47 family)